MSLKRTFRTAFDETDPQFDGPQPKTKAEQRIIRASQSIREKEGWQGKLHSSDILQKWETEALAQQMTKEEFTYVLDELRYYLELKADSVEPAAVDGTWQADGLIKEELTKKFKETVWELLENIPEERRDYHPGSDGLVVDLVHPSLYCFVEGVTHLTNENAAGHTTEQVQWDGDQSTKFQWLPTEFQVSKTGEVTAESYINNLHPQRQKALYPLIEQLLTSFLPLFEKVLTDLQSPRQNRIETTLDWYDVTDAGPDEDDCSDSSEYQDKYAEWVESRPISLPTPPPFVPPTTNQPIKLNGKILQVIVKIASIELTPEKPRYNGGVWHVEGTQREAIVASGIYYSGMENVSESRLCFRTAVSDPPYEQGDDRGVKEVFGILNYDLMNQELGSIVAKEGRCIAFPNVYQHRVAPFELVDKEKKGFRKIVVFFLVNPEKRLVSTKDVAPQQKEWVDGWDGFGWDMVEMGKWTMGVEEARRYREELMHERKFVRDKQNEEVYERPFSLCEH